MYENEANQICRKMNYGHGTHGFMIMLNLLVYAIFPLFNKTLHQLSGKRTSS